MPNQLNLVLVSFFCTMTFALNAQHKTPKATMDQQQSTSTKTTSPTHTPTHTPSHSTTPSSNYSSPKTTSPSTSSNSSYHYNQSNSNNNSSSHSGHHNTNNSNNSSNNTSNSTYNSGSYHPSSSNSNYYNNNNGYNGWNKDWVGIAENKKDKFVTLYTEQELLDKSDKKLYTQKAIRPTIKGVEVPFQKFSVTAEEGAALKMASGTHVSIPANAFQYKNGKIAQGAVDIEFREFHNPAELLASGIPMYDAKNQIYMESAGMFEINAKQNGESLQLQNGQTIKVDLLSQNTANTFDTWEFNPKTKNWSEIDGKGQPEAKVIGTDNQEDIALLTSLNTDKTKLHSPSQAKTVEPQNHHNTTTTDPRHHNNTNQHPHHHNANQHHHNNVFLAVRPTEVTTLGLKNIDQARSFISPAPVVYSNSIITFDKKIPETRKKRKIKFYLLAKYGKAIIPMTRQNIRDFQSLEKDQSIVAILPNQRIATYTYENYKEKGTYDSFMFRVADQKIQSIEDLQTALTASTN